MNANISKYNGVYQSNQQTHTFEDNQTAEQRRNRHDHEDSRFKTHGCCVHSEPWKRARARVCALVTAYGMLMARAPYDQGYRPFLLPTRSHAVYFAPVSFTTTNVTHEYTPDDPGPLHYVTKLT